MQETRKANHLINETSPYLLQHAYNPVDWYPWGEEALTKAKQDDKPIILSIGYSSCHWCHVMEHESFESEETAKLMNENFICIKVDREERPDIDQIYMEAMQTLGVGGGWPLNAFLTSDTKPFFGGTYFQPERWRNVLKNVAKTYEEKKEDIKASADEVAQALQASDVARYGLNTLNKDFNQADLPKIYSLLERRYDKEWGGMGTSPKFPMPSIYRFLLRYHELTGDQTALDHVNLTLHKMGQGGIYDQLGGGFARYSTDEQWFAPHFEKMMYDNGQLITLYSEAYKVTKDPFYKDVVYETLEFVKREMTSAENAFYSALDADSEGEEGKYYVWEYDELENHLEGTDLKLFREYYDIKPSGNWEIGNILFRQQTDAEFVKKFNLTQAELRSKKQDWKTKLLPIREERVHPGLDDKALTSWNALMLKGYSDAFRTFREPSFLEAALKNAQFIEEKLGKGEGLLHTYKEGKASLMAYLDDYVLLAEAYISLYQATFDMHWLERAKALTDYGLAHFYDEKEKLFYYTDNASESLIARKKELFDNVIPASNSVMASNLYHLGLLYDDNNYTSIAVDMMARMHTALFKEPQFLTNWACLYTSMLTPTAEVVIVGEYLKKWAAELEQEAGFNSLFMGAKQETSALPLMESKSALDGTTVYVCFEKTCKKPVTSLDEAKKLLRGE